MLTTACNKEDEAIPEETAVEDNSVGMAESDNVIEISEDVMAERSSGMRTEEMYTTAAACGTVTLTPKGINAPGKIVVDFGTGTVCRDKKTRKGKILIEFTSRYRAPGTTQTITFDNYFVNEVKVEGTKVLTHSLAAGVFTTKVLVTGGKMTFADGTSVTWNSERFRNADTKSTVAINDDEFKVYGTMSGINRKGVSYTAVIAQATPITLKASCTEISGTVAVQGIIKVTPLDLPERTVDFGDGTCDRKMTITVNGKSREMTIRG